MRKNPWYLLNICPECSHADAKYFAVCPACDSYQPHYRLSTSTVYARVGYAGVWWKPWTWLKWRVETRRYLGDKDKETA